MTFNSLHCLKKMNQWKLVAMMTLLFVVATAGSVMAYPGNPYVDVPQGHWAYNAVMQLSKAGIVDINDKTFNGDKLITRYEMATIIAKAMAKYEKADAPNKATIDKLKAEFAEDLKNQGVRLDNIERKLVEHQISGEFKMIYSNPDTTINGVKQADATAFYTRSRVVFNGTLDGLDYEFRLQNVSGLRDASAGSSDGFTIMNRSNVGGKMFGGRWVFGRQADHNLDVWVTDATIKGVSAFYTVGKVDLIGRFGKECVSIPSYFANAAYTNSNDEHTVLIASTTIGKTFIGAEYHNLRFHGTSTMATDPYNTYDDNRSIVGVEAHGNIAPKLLFSTAYSKATSNFENKGYKLSLTYGTVNPAVAGSQNFVATYHYVGINSVYQPNTDLDNIKVGNVYTGVKGFVFTYNYVPRKNTALVFGVTPNNKALSYDAKNTTLSVTGYFWF
ncbi:MAG: S-layer y domain protein [Firmicutes bacterium]|nr:S-layer y domain protein [Bacillota bacterium]